MEAKREYFSKRRVRTSTRRTAEEMCPRVTNTC